MIKINNLTFKQAKNSCSRRRSNGRKTSSDGMIFQSDIVGQYSFLRKTFENETFVALEYV